MLSLEELISVVSKEGWLLLYASLAVRHHHPLSSTHAHAHAQDEREKKKRRRRKTTTSHVMGIAHFTQFRTLINPNNPAGRAPMVMMLYLHPQKTRLWPSRKKSGIGSKMAAYFVFCSAP
jgi:hypothetical protein